MSYRRGIIDQQFKNVKVIIDDNKDTNSNIIINNEPSIIKDFNNLFYSYSSQLIKTIEDMNAIQNNFNSLFINVSSDIIETINEVNTIQYNLSSNWQATSDQTYNNIIPAINDIKIDLEVIDAGFF